MSTSARACETKAKQAAIKSSRFMGGPPTIEGVLRSRTLSELHPHRGFRQGGKARFDSAIVGFGTTERCDSISRIESDSSRPLARPMNGMTIHRGTNEN